MHNRLSCLLSTGTVLRNDTNSGKTLSALFSNFSPEEISQIYFSSEKPNVLSCNSYFQINESQLLKSAFGIISSKCGFVFDRSNIDVNDSKPKTRSSFIINNSTKTFAIVGRALLWIFSFWKNKKYKKWLEKVNPSVLFTVMTGETIQIKNVKYISKKYKCPVIMYITDDYYHDFYKKHSIVRKIHYKRLEKAYKSISNNLKFIIGISNEASQYFGRLFNRPYRTIYAACDDSFYSLPLKKHSDEIVVFRYFGGIGLGRWQTLRQLGETIKKINGNRTIAILEIYSLVDDDSIIKSISVKNGSIFKGWVASEEYKKLLATTDVAVHVESFSQEMISRTKMSISTKLTDYLAAGKCIIGIGDSSLASIRHIQTVATTVEHLEDLEHRVLELIKNPQKRIKQQLLARSLALKEHNRSINASIIRKLVIQHSNKTN